MRSFTRKCSLCSGDGTVGFSPCPACGGKRYLRFFERRWLTRIGEFIEVVIGRVFLPVATVLGFLGLIAAGISIVMTLKEEPWLLLWPLLMVVLAILANWKDWTERLDPVELERRLKDVKTGL